MKKMLKITVFIGTILMFAVLIGGGIFISNVMNISKQVTFDKEKLLSASAQVTLLDIKEQDFTKNSELLTTYASLENLPNHVPDSFISIEDKRFFEHHGLDYKRIAKAMYNNMINGRVVEGASTISQQLIKNTHLTNEKTLTRKIKEMILTKKLEKSMSKKDILETYLNTIYFGESAYGIDAASETYFSKPANELSIGESALLAGIIKSPGTYSPIDHYEAAIERRNLVLKLMKNNNKITPSQYQEEISLPISLNLKQKIQSTNYLYAKATLMECGTLLNLSDHEIASSGYTIETYLNQETQNQLHLIMQNSNNFATNHLGNQNDRLGILVDNTSFGVTAFDGCSPYNLTNFERQPGSVIKPALVYAPALEKGIISPETVILDEAIDFNGYQPHNVGNEFHGYVSVKEIISKSLNIPAVKVLDYVGIEQGKQYASRLGYTFSDQDVGYAVALGGLTNGNTLKQITNSFLPFATLGKFKTAHFVKKITDRKGKVVYENVVPAQNVVTDDVAYLMTDMLLDGVANGTSKKLSTLPFMVAGKTGTVSIPNTNQNTDAYSIAYTTQHTMGVWVGNYSNEPKFVMEGNNNGGTYATGVIKTFMENFYEKQKPADFTIPDSVVSLKIDAKLLTDEHKILLADENCPERYQKSAYFAKRFAPSEVSTQYTDLTAQHFDVSLSENIATVTFDAKDFLQYKIIQTQSGKETALRTVDNFSGLYEFKTPTLQSGKTYEYHLVISNPFSNIYNTSEPIIIQTPTKQDNMDQLLEKLQEKPNVKTPSTSWYFQA